MKKLLQSLFILLFIATSAIAQDRTITGTVTAQEDGLPLPGVSVRIKDASNSGVSTNAAGKFSIKVSAEAKVLIFSSVGYSTQEIAIRGSVVNASLETDSKSLSEVVVDRKSVV